MELFNKNVQRSPHLKILFISSTFMETALISTLTVISTLGMASSAQAATIFFTSFLSGDQIIDTPNFPGSSATGIASMELNEDMDELAYELTLNGLGLESSGGTATKLHFHTGFADEKSPFHVLHIVGPEDDRDMDAMLLVDEMDTVTVKGIWSDEDSTCPPLDLMNLDDCNRDPNKTKRLSDYVDDLIAGGLYINIHTTTVPSGEIRGQIERIPSPPEQVPVSTPEPGTILGLVGVLGLAGLNVSQKKH